MKPTRNRVRWWTPAILSMLALAACAGCARFAGTDAARPVSLGALGVAVTNEPASPRVGENTLVVRVFDGNGHAVEGAEVEVVVAMPAMGAMPAMESRGRVARAATGSYRAAYGLAMAGDWDVRVRVSSPGQAPVEGTWRLSTTRAGVNFAGAETADTTGLASAGPGGAAGGPGAIAFDAARRQAVGITTAPAEMRTLEESVRARGTVVYDETRRAVVSPRYSGWVRRLAADFTGKAVRKGELLCTVDSPELRSAEEEYLAALRFASADSTAHAMAFGAGAAGGAPPSLSLAEAARRRLLSWDLPPDVILELARRGAPLAEIPLRAPVSGVVVEKSVVAGSPITPGQVLFAIASVDPAWVEARVAETDLARVRVGAAASVRAPGASEERKGRVAFVAPALDVDSRSGVARIALANPGGALKPGMFVDVTIVAPLGRRLAVPEGAVVPTGTRNVVFVDPGDGTLVPREVELGAHADGWIEIVRGVKAGERVVTAGNFLVASDARLSAALKNW